MTAIPPTSPTDAPDVLANNAYETDYEIGQDNVEVMGLDVHNPVFFTSAALVILFSAVSLIFPEASSLAMASAKTWTLQSADWLFAITPVIVLLFSLSLAIASGWADLQPYLISRFTHG